MPRGRPFQKGESGNPRGRPKQTPEEVQLIEACRAKTPEALAVIGDLMDHSANDRVRLAAAQFIIERGYGKAPERIELLDSRDQGPLPGAEPENINSQYRPNIKLLRALQKKLFRENI